MANLYKKIENSPTFFLFVEPSCLEGAARLIDLGGTMNVYNESETAAEADALAIYNDWRAVGNDLRYAIQEYERTRATANTTK